MAVSAEQIGAWLRECRERHGEYSQEQAAAKVGTTSRNLWAWEKGKYAPPADQFFALVVLYGKEAVQELPALVAKWERANAAAANGVVRRAGGGKRREE